MIRFLVYSVILVLGLIFFPPLGLVSTVGLGFLLVIQAINDK